MVAIPPPTHSTVRRIYELHEQKRDNAPRAYLGASELGESCSRRLWYGFRWLAGEQFDGRMLRLFAAGDRFEERIINELRAIGVRIEGQQHEVIFADGHGGGHMDGAALGLEEAPKTWHLLEAKTHNTKSFADLQKKGVRESKPKHYAQMQLYMGLASMERAAYVAENKDTSELHFERVEFDEDVFERLIAKAKAIVEAPVPPPRISEDAAWYECKFCPFNAQCHGVAPPSATCRSCAHSTPIAAGAWQCERHGGEIPLDFQRTGCDDHRFIPALLEHLAELVEADGDRVRWRNKLTDKTFDQPGYTSAELAACKDWRIVGDDFMQGMKEVFGVEAKVSSAPPVETGDAPASDLHLFYREDNGSNSTRSVPRRAARRTAKA